MNFLLGLALNTSSMYILNCTTLFVVVSAASLKAPRGLQLLWPLASNFKIQCIELHSTSKNKLYTQII